MFAQRGWMQDSIRVPDGADTTVYLYFWTESPWGISFDYKDFDDVDAILDLGECPVADGSIFNRLDSDDLPFTLADSTVAFEKMAYNFRYLAIKLTKNSVTAGLYMHFYITRDDRIGYAMIEPKPGYLPNERLFALKD
jgi:hypothetical protein